MMSGVEGNLPNLHAETTAATAAMAEPEHQSFGSLDIILLTTLLAAVTFWFLRKHGEKKQNFRIEPQKDEDDDSSFISKMKNTGRNIIVFYGSQTGTAEEFAARIAKEANRYGMKAMVADPEEYEMEDLSKVHEIENSMAIFCMATYGEGDPTDNAQEFNQWLQSGSADLTGLNYAVFGLGNKTYEHYNSMGKYVDSRLEELGASRVYEVGLGDDDANIEEDFITWKEKFWGAVCEYFHIETLGEDINLRQFELVVHDDVPQEKIFTGEITRLNSYTKQRPPFDLKNPFLAPIRMKRELYSGERSCIHLEIDITGAKIRYDTGDHVAIYPTNNPLLVEKIGKLLDVDLETVFSLRNLDEDSTKKHPFPCPTTYRTALLHYVDLSSIPRTHILKEIAEYASNEDHKKMLKSMASSSAEGRERYLTWVVKNCRSIIHILEDLPSLKPPLDLILELLPRLHPRYYSISSSPKVHPTSVHVTAVVIEYKTPTDRPVSGVATGWLSNMTIDSNNNPVVPVFVRRSQFRLPSKVTTPIIMIGPGTGLAPFRGFIQERALYKSEEKPVGDTILYFGCRKAAEDFLYKDELEKYLAEGVLTKMYLAFSRDQEHKIYVTHLLKQNREEIWDVIGERNGHIYVCGDARSMAKDVHNIILDVIQDFGQKSKAEAEAYIKKMESQRRYCADVWS